MGDEVLKLKRELNSSRIIQVHEVSGLCRGTGLIHSFISSDNLSKRALLKGEFQAVFEEQVRCAEQDVLPRSAKQSTLQRLKIWSKCRQNDALSWPLPF